MISQLAGKILNATHFIISARGKRHLYIAQGHNLNQGIDVHDVAREYGYNLGLTEELLTLSYHFPAQQLNLKRPLLALGSITSHQYGGKSRNYSPGIIAAANANKYSLNMYSSLGFGWKEGNWNFLLQKDD